MYTAVHVLWWYESADHRAAVRHKAHSDARVVSAGNIYVHIMSFPTTLVPFLTTVTNM